jgi:hypothetical protein
MVGFPADGRRASEAQLSPRLRVQANRPMGTSGIKRRNLGVRSRPHDSGKALPNHLPKETRMTDLFSPARFGAIDLANRVVMSSLTRNRAGTGNVPTPLIAEYYRQRASAGLILTEASPISAMGHGYPRTPGIHTTEQIDGWKQVTAAVHAAGGKIALQLWHVGRISHPDLLPDGALPVAPLNAPDYERLYTGEAKGYTDYPTLAA